MIAARVLLVEHLERARHIVHLTLLLLSLLLLLFERLQLNRAVLIFVPHAIVHSVYRRTCRFAIGGGRHAII